MCLCLMICIYSFLNIEHPERVEDSLSKFGTADDIDYIVVSDGEEVSRLVKQQA